MSANKLLSFSVLATALALPALALPACGKNHDKENATGNKVSKGAGAKSEKMSKEVIKIDGSSTVFPITQAVAEEFQIALGGRVTVGVSGTGGGFKKFCRGETAISGASRPIKASELAKCKEAGIEFIELPVAYDGIAVVTNNAATWVDFLTTGELKTIWAPEAEGKITKWSDVRKGWPDSELHLLGPGTDSGTYDYFTKAIVGKEHSSRGDFAPNVDPNVMVHGVSTDKAALAYFGFAYYKENKDKLRLIPINDGKEDNGAGAVSPSAKTVADGTYQPLSRPIFIYVSTKAMKRTEVNSFVDFYLSKGRALVAEVGYVPLSDKTYDLVAKRFADKKTGSLFSGGAQVGATVEGLLSK